MGISQGNPGTTTGPSDKARTQAFPAVESPTILLVDDDPSILNLCSQCLIEEGFTVLRAATGPEALQICKQYPGPIDLLITDLVLAPPRLQLRSSKVQQPSMNGVQLMQQVLALRQHAKVILMSGHTDEALESLYIMKQGLPFLRKPFSITTLVRMAREALDVQNAQFAQVSASRG
jgi:DNA-binding NtrC family response regulator